MIVPGACLLRWIDRSRTTVPELLLAGFLTSPLLLVLAALVAIATGASAHTAALAAVAVATIVILCTAPVSRPAPSPVPSPAPRAEIVGLTLLTVGLVVLTATLPFTREWWRIRSDAWFHVAVVAQIRDFGLPPQDPYFVGMPLQYMWLYHVIVLTLSDALRVDAFWVMAAFNAQATAALVLAAYYFAAVLRPSWAHRLAGAATILFTFNGAFWIFLPIKLVKAVIGEVRGWEEIRRTFALTPLNYDTACRFMNIYFNQEFFLDKFMVATAFGASLVFMIAGWAGAVEFLRSGRRFALALVAVAVIGMLGLHSLVGFVFLVGAVGGVALLHLFRRRVDGYRPRAALALAATAVACFLVMTPYLYLVMHAKESEQIFPIDFSPRKIAGIAISCAFVLVMAWRARAFWSDRGAGPRFLAFGAAAVTIFCCVIALPGPNTADKLGYFVFIPLAVIAGFAVADDVLARAGRARATAAIKWALLFYLPVNAIAFVSCFATPDAVEVTAAEKRLSAWVREHTPRASVFIDDHDRVPLLVTGPRRYFFGRLAYAEQWGYDRTEMSRRRHVVEALYAQAPLDFVALDTLASLAEPVFVVVRPEHGDSAVARRSDLFATVFSDPEIALVRADREACRAALRASSP